MRKIFFIAMLSAFVFINCKEESNEPVYLFETSKEYFGFKDNSTWKYKKEGKPGEEISFKCENSQSGIASKGASQTEFIFYDMVPDKGDKISVRIEAGSKDKVDRIVFINTSDTGINYSPILWNTGLGYRGQSGSTVKLLDTFTVNNVVYKDVLHIVPSAGEPHKEVYFAKGVGIIQRTLSGTNDTFTILEHNIIQ
jgi:hypothetical protein